MTASAASRRSRATRSSPLYSLSTSRSWSSSSCIFGSTWWPAGLPGVWKRASSERGTSRWKWCSGSTVAACWRTRARPAPRAARTTRSEVRCRCGWWSSPARKRLRKHSPSLWGCSSCAGCLFSSFCPWVCLLTSYFCSIKCASSAQRGAQVSCHFFFFLTHRMPSSDLIDVVIEHLVGRRSFAVIWVIFQIITLLLNVRG